MKDVHNTNGSCPGGEGSAREDEDAETGGVKKIIYTGSTKKRTLFDNDENSDRQWNYQAQQIGAKPGHQFNLDDVWSIKKNVEVSKGQAANQQKDDSFWVRPAGQGYYSRHGTVKDAPGGPSHTPSTSYNKFSYSNMSPANFSGSSSPGVSPRDGAGLPASRPGKMNNGTGVVMATTTERGNQRNGPLTSRHRGPGPSGNQPRRF